jgi:hypothetical protein
MRTGTHRLGLDLALGAYPLPAWRSSNEVRPVFRACLILVEFQGFKNELLRIDQTLRDVVEARVFAAGTMRQIANSGTEASRVQTSRSAPRFLFLKCSPRRTLKFCE